MATANDALDLVEAEGQGEDELESKEKFLQKCFVHEWGILKSIIDQIVSREGVTDPSSVRRFRSIVSKYQEQCQLLEPYMESIVSPLMLVIRRQALDQNECNETNMDIIKRLCTIIYSLVTICGYKAVTRFFPHQVADLEIAVSLLDKCRDSRKASLSLQEGTGEMETECVLLLWLSILVLVPFDISLMDTSLANNEVNTEGEFPPLVNKILGFSKDYLCNAGPMRKISGLLLSKFLVRPDMRKAFVGFMQWTIEVLSSSQDDSPDVVLLLGAVDALAAIFKAGSRDTLLEVAPVIWGHASNIFSSATAMRSPLLRKSLTKLTQHIGLICLPRRSLGWHYVGRTSSLRDNLSSSAAEVKVFAESCPENSSSPAFAVPFYEEEELDVPEIIEEMIEKLLIGLRDSDTIVRWCAAKGMGRITSRLTSAFSEEILSSILELFSVGEGDGSWHGGCLALAELARRGLLLPVNLKKVALVIIKALHYDVRRGPHSVGSHVRDAAAYVCWAFGRAYIQTDMRGVLESLAPHLLAIACYDREVNCRRAAAAAFQENVGRQGNFPHGIDIVNKADYFSLSSLVNSYLEIAVYIAQYEEYLQTFIEELLSYKICHWDKSLREVSSKALAALVKYNPEYFGSFLLDKLIPLTLSTDLNTRHGATLSVSEVVLALKECEFTLSADIQQSIGGIIPAIEKARLYRGKGGEIMRMAVSRLVKCISLSCMTLSEKAKHSLLDTVNENLKHPNAVIQASAVEALKCFLSAYFVGADDPFVDGLIKQYVSLLYDSNASARRGSALTLGALPFVFLVKRWMVVLTNLCSSCLIQENVDFQDVEARVNAVKGVIAVCETLTANISSSFSNNLDEEIAFYLAIKNEVMPTLFKALNDYSVDNRGDVGSWVREAAMDGLEKCACLLSQKQSFDSAAGDAKVGFSKGVYNGTPTIDKMQITLFDEDLGTKLVGVISKQAVEKIDKVRNIAGKILQRILYNRKVFVECIPHRLELENILPNNADLNWGAPNISYQYFVKLLQFSCYSKLVLSGLVISTGGLSDSLCKASVSALLEYLQVSGVGKSEERSMKIYMLSIDILWVLHQYKKDDRVIIPTLKTVEVLLNKMAFTPLEGDRSQSFADSLSDVLAVEMTGSKDFSKLSTGLSILGYIASIEEQNSTNAFSQLIGFLGHKYPKIRKAAADQVYLALLQKDSLVSEGQLEKAVEVLGETCWEASLEEARRQRVLLQKLVGLKV